MVDGLKFHKRVDELVCNWSVMMGHSFTEEEMNSLVDLIADDFKAQAVGIHKAGVRAGKELERLFPDAPNRPVEKEGG